MDESKRRAIQFLEKEIKTYVALALFLSKKGVQQHLRAGDKGTLLSPAFYKERMKEAKGLVSELRKPN
ncbi:MAG TPA: hypothetical protein VN682_04330 [Terriglobales bacterium]|nr:hypothetical protein [Terriglobales bacterium]